MRTRLRRPAGTRLRDASARHAAGPTFVTLVLLTAGVWGQTRPNPAYPGAPGGPPSVEPQRFETTSTAIVVDVVVRSLRQKLGPQANRVETARGVGYRLK